jgi:hypothetical protein
MTGEGAKMGAYIGVSTPLVRSIDQLYTLSIVFKIELAQRGGGNREIVSL